MGSAIPQISFIAAFMAGFLSFVSPCVLPLVPSYVSYITGLSVEQLADATERHRFRKAIIANSLLFIAGFSSVFIAFGASASLIGRVLYDYQGVIRKVGGVLIILIGIYLLLEVSYLLTLRLKGLVQGWLDRGGSTPRVAVLRIGKGACDLLMTVLNLRPLQALRGEARYHFKSRPVGYFGSFIIGTAFAAAWTPCVGPVLGAILAYASTTDSLQSGIMLLASYSLGLGIPLFVTALGVDTFLSYFKQVRSYLWGVEALSGAVLVAVGAMIYVDSFTMITSFLERYGIGWYIGQ